MSGISIVVVMNFIFTLKYVILFLFLIIRNVKSIIYYCNKFYFYVKIHYYKIHDYKIHNYKIHEYT